MSGKEAIGRREESRQARIETPTDVFSRSAEFPREFYRF